MPILAILLAVAVLGGGAVVASDNAGPGDFLFSVDRAVENVRVAVASEKGKDELRVKFAEERVGEVEKIVSKQASDIGAAVSDKDLDNIDSGLNVAIDTITKISANLSQDENAELKAALDGVIATLNANLGKLPTGARSELNTRLGNNRGNEEILVGGMRLKIELDDDDEIEIELEDEDEDDAEDEEEIEDEDVDDEENGDMEDENENGAGESGGVGR